MISGGNRKPLNAELGTAGIGRERRGIIPSPSPPTAVVRQCNSAIDDVKLQKTHGSDKVVARQLKDPHFRAEWERTAVARAVALRLVEYRVEHALSQTALARQLGMKQPAVARLEAGEHNPSFDTLARLSSTLGIEFHIAVTPEGVAI